MTLLLGLAFASEGDLSGYAEVRGTYSHDVEGTPWLLVERLRPTLEIEPHPRARVVVSPQLAMPQGRYDQEVVMDLLDAQAGDLLDLAGCDLSVPDRIQTIDDVLTLQRFYVDVYTPKVDIRVGRQALNWGSAMFLNPTDLFAQNLVAQPWQERQGVNAVRFSVPFGNHQLLAVAALEDDLETGRFALKPTFNVLGTDVAAVASWRTTDELPVVGWDLRGTLGAGFWVEGRTALDEPAAVVSAGLDYSFPVLDQLYVAAQYTFDATGVDPEDYTLGGGGDVGVDSLVCENLPESSDTTDDVAPRQGFTQGRQYALGTVRLGYETVSGGVTALVNVEDGSTMLLPSVGWAPGSAWSLNVLASIPLGEGEFAPGPELTTFDDPVELDFSGLLPAWTVTTYVRYSL
jgi:hypothetical protein